MSYRYPKLTLPRELSMALAQACTGTDLKPATYCRVALVEKLRKDGYLPPIKPESEATS